MELKGFDKNVAIDQDKALRPKMVTVEIAGKKHEVPEGIRSSRPCGTAARK